MSRSVIVIGGGIVGCATAYFSAREGMSVTLLESQHVGYGASGRNPGFVWLHCRNPGLALEISRVGRQLYPELLEELPGGFEFRAEGGLIYFNTPEQGRVFEEFVASRRADGLDMELIDGAEVRKLVGPIRPDVLGASYCSEDAQINTPTVVAALARGAAEHGAEIREGVKVTGLIKSGEQVVGVTTDAGDVHADAVVIATGVWSPELLDLTELGIGSSFGAERLQVIATHPLPQQIRPVVYGPLATKQYSLFRDLPSWDDELFRMAYESEEGIEMLQLVSQRANGEVLLGCPMDYPGEVDLRPTLAGIAATTQAISEDFPGLVNAPIDRVWAGMLPFTADMVPVLGEVLPGAFLASGHVFGNAAGPASGQIMAQLLLGREPGIDMTECRYPRPLPEIVPGTPARW